MSTNEVRNNDATVAGADMKFELIKNAADLLEAHELLEQVREPERV